MPIRVLLREYPHRAVALATDDHVLSFRHSSAESDQLKISSNSRPSPQNGASPQCMVDFSPAVSADLTDFRSLTSLTVHGTLGLVTIGGDVFLCVVNGANRVASVRSGENIQQITSVDFHCINRSDHDYLLADPNGRHSSDYQGDDDEYDGRHGQVALEHPCLALKKLLSGGTFYYSADFDLTRRLQDRPPQSPTIALDSFDRGFLWNAFMIQPLVNFRSRLSESERLALDGSRILTSAIRGFAKTLTVPAASAPISTNFSGLPSTITLISRLSCRRAGTRFNARGIDDDGNVANFVETETIYTAPTGLSFSYVQIRGSVPVFWEQAAGFTPGQQKIQLTRSAEATQPAFDKHFTEMEAAYGAVHIVNLLGNDKPGEVDLTQRYRHHVDQSPLNDRAHRSQSKSSKHDLLRETDYDFHAETRGQGYEAAQSIRYRLQDSADAFVYFLAEEIDEEPKTGGRREKVEIRRTVPVLQQEGIFRTNCLDCLDRTNVVQTIISQMALEEFVRHRGERRSSGDFALRHSTLWADNGDALSKIYAGTGALKSSFTRSGKMSLAGALADVRKSATRLYINNFEDKGRQTTIDMLLGRLMGQNPVHLFDPINDYVSTEMSRRTVEFTSTKTISIVCGTFNLNGKHPGRNDDLSLWLCPPLEDGKQPEIVAVGFQEIVELSPQQIMSTDPSRRTAWEAAVKETLNRVSQQAGDEEYVLLRGGQLVGLSLSVFVKASILPLIKNVEGSLKKTGMSGMAGNKGAVAIRMDFANTSICLVTAHLAAGFANYEERNQDYSTIINGLKFQRNRTIEDHDSIIWLGDFNYRIGMSNDRVRQLIKASDIETLYENDQLHLQMMNGRTFPHYNEARITFAPTYKYDNGTDHYDSSDKARIPAWCDRILWKGGNVRQLEYYTAALRFSDHRPVYATFECAVTVVDEKVKQRINDTLYKQRRSALANGTAIAGLTSDDDDPLDYETIEPGLPPASSDKRKWWLDGGLPARSQVKPPSNGMGPNSNRPSNPYTPSSEPDWVKVERPSPSPKPAAPPPRRIPARSNSTQSVDSRRRLPPPASQQVPQSARPSAQDDDLPPPLPSRASTFNDSISDPVRDKPRTLSKSKGAPPIPRKPPFLKSDSGSIASADPSSSPITRSERTQTGSPSPAPTPSAAKAQPPPPASRRSTLTKAPPPSQDQPAQRRIPSSTASVQSRKPVLTDMRIIDPQLVARTPKGGQKLPAARIPGRTRSSGQEEMPQVKGRPTGQSMGGVQIMSTEKGKGNLMDEGGDLEGWEPLQPM